MLLRLQETALKLCLDPLKLLLDSIASNVSESSPRDSYLRALGFEVSRTKSDEHELLFIGVLYRIIVGKVSNLFPIQI
jgi:hypothetical protein